MKRFSKVYFEVLFVIGLLLSIVVSVNHAYDFLPDFIKGMFTSLSYTLIIVAVIVKSSSKIQYKLQIATNDERIRSIEGKASIITLYSIMFLNVTCIVIFGFLGDPFITISLILALIMFAGLVILFLTKIILSKRM